MVRWEALCGNRSIGCIFDSIRAIPGYINAFASACRMAETTDNTSALARRKSNLAFSFLCLEEERRLAMADFYDFCRQADDIVDDPDRSDAEKQARLDQWRQEIAACYRPGDIPKTPLGVRLRDIIHRYAVPREPMEAILDGLQMDIGSRRFASFEELRRYCYGVASAVGLVCIRIFGCRHPHSERYAENLGYALQLTNILRDVVEDITEYGRVYVPQDEMQALGVTEEMLREPWKHWACQQLYRQLAFRARHYFARAHRYLVSEDCQALEAARIMSAFYQEILHRLEANGCRPQQKKVKLGKAKKVQLLLHTRQSVRRPHRSSRLPGTVAVLGAGVAGMAASVALAREGFRVVLVEARKQVGGRAGSFVDSSSGLVLDNGQHIAMGCYREFLQLADWLGVREKLRAQERLDLTFVGGDGQRSTLRAARWPAPWHLLAALVGCRGFSWGDRVAILRLGLHLQNGPPPGAAETVGSWLERLQQPPNTLRLLWKPFCLAALNEPLETASARLLHSTLRRSLFGQASDSALFFCDGGLGRLFWPECERYLRATGGIVLTAQRVRSLEFVDSRLVRLVGDDRFFLEPDFCISALPWTALRSLLPRQEPLQKAVQEIRGASILGVHLWVDQPFTDAEVTGLPDSRLHWVFDRSRSLRQQGKEGALYAITVSAADQWENLRPTQVEAIVRQELTRHFPEFVNRQVRRCLTYVARDATFLARPVTEELRPGTRTPWSNFFLAGDWTDTGLPATLEGAAQSGFSAARALLDDNDSGDWEAVAEADLLAAEYPAPAIGR